MFLEYLKMEHYLVPIDRTITIEAILNGQRSIRHFTTVIVDTKSNPSPPPPENYYPCLYCEDEFCERDLTKHLGADHWGILDQAPADIVKTIINQHNNDWLTCVVCGAVI